MRLVPRRPTFSNVTDRRRVLADWMTSPTNPFFTRMIVNRLWAHYLGQGLVTPIDDLRETNPATNEPLLDALCVAMKEARYDLKAFTRMLLNSRVYQLSPTTNATNQSDRQNFSHALDKALPAEVLLDMVCQTTGVHEKFNGWPLGYRAIELWDSRVPTYFFRIFGRPSRTSLCECERSNEPSIAQALHLLNSPEVMEKIQHRHGAARRQQEEIHGLIPTPRIFPSLSTTALNCILIRPARNGLGTASLIRRNLLPPA
jgi:hypothetical protein